MSLPILLQQDQMLEEYVKKPVLSAVLLLARNCTISRNTQILNMDLILESDFGDVQFIEVEGEFRKDICKKYKVTALPTIIFFQNNVEMERLEGTDIEDYPSKLIAYRNLAAEAQSAESIPSNPSFRPQTAPAGGSEEREIELPDEFFFSDPEITD